MFSPTVGPICYTEEMFLYILFIDCICVLIKDVYKYLNMFVLRSYMRFKNATMEDENLLFQEWKPLIIRLSKKMRLAQFTEGFHLKPRKKCR